MFSAFLSIASVLGSEKHIEIVSTDLRVFGRSGITGGDPTFWGVCIFRALVWLPRTDGPLFVKGPHLESVSWVGLSWALRCCHVLASKKEWESSL